MHRPSVESMLMRAWMRRGLPWLLMLPLSWLFGALAALRRLLYRVSVLPSTRMPVPVIVVGNIFIGGTGKTPLTIWLVELLQRAGYTPGIVSRGFGADATQPQPVDATADPQQVGDEPVLIAQRSGAPVMVARKRALAAQALLTAHPQIDVLIADDGLQHYALKRDIEILLFDERGTGNGSLLPAGPLREPADRRCDFTIVNCGTSGKPAGIGGIAMRLTSTHAHPLQEPSRQLPLTELAALPQAAKGIVAAAGIGNPARFFSMLRDAGLTCNELPLPDHFDFSMNPFASLAAGLILITEKDAVKCRAIDGLKGDARIWVVPVSAQIENAFAEQLLEKLRGLTIA